MPAAASCLRPRLVQSCRAHMLGTRRLPHERLVLNITRSFRCTRAVFQDGSSSVSSTYAKRQQALLNAGFNEYPRVFAGSEGTSECKRTTIRQFNKQYKDFRQPDGTADAKDDIHVCGRVNAKRTAGSNLLFIDLIEQPGSHKLQVVVEKNKLPVTAEVATEGRVKEIDRLIERGDTISVRGKPYRTRSGELSLSARAIPTLLSPCLRLPVDNFGPDSDHAHDRHVEMRVDPSLIDVLVARSRILDSIHDFFRGRGFINVQTPILAASAGGAIARPFQTTATEFANRNLSLRIAPELWLKRLIIGGMDRIYEIGPSFRNEGIDKTHNPEFTTCEFYATHASIRTLMTLTRRLIDSVSAQLSQVGQLDASFRRATLAENESAWPTIDFISALNEALAIELPDLSDPSAREALLHIFRSKNLPIPAVPTLPRLLDKLSSIYLEPHCTSATWIFHPPECLSPLAKSFPHPRFPNQRVAARAELFIHNKEVVNCYEEENSPFEQRRKFIDQQKFARLTSEDGKEAQEDDEAMQIDEDYIKALEWGMPPTGGWGCGIDRLCMLMLGKERIEDVLSFGNLRSVTRGATQIQQ